MKRLAFSPACRRRAREIPARSVSVVAARHREEKGARAFPAPRNNYWERVRDRFALICRRVARYADDNIAWNALNAGMAGWPKMTAFISRGFVAFCLRIYLSNVDEGEGAPSGRVDLVRKTRG